MLLPRAEIDRINAEALLWNRDSRRLVESFNLIPYDDDGEWKPEECGSWSNLQGN